MQKLPLHCVTRCVLDGPGWDGAWWHTTQSVRRFSSAHSPPPLYTGRMWSACLPASAPLCQTMASAWYEGNCGLCTVQLLPAATKEPAKQVSTP